MICLGIDHRPSGALRAEQQLRRLRWVLIDPSFSEASALMRAQEVLGFTYITLPPLGKKGIHEKLISWTVERRHTVFIWEQTMRRWSERQEWRGQLEKLPELISHLTLQTKCPISPPALPFFALRSRLWVRAPVRCGANFLPPLPHCIKMHWLL